MSVNQNFGSQRGSSLEYGIHDSKADVTREVHIEKENVSPTPSTKQGSPSASTSKRAPLADCTDNHPGYAVVDGNRTQLRHKIVAETSHSHFDRALDGVGRSVPYASPSKKRSQTDQRLVKAYSKLDSQLNFKIWEDQDQFSRLARSPDLQHP